MFINGRLWAGLEKSDDHRDGTQMCIYIKEDMLWDDTIESVNRDCVVGPAACKTTAIGRQSDGTKIDGKFDGGTNVHT